VFIYCRLLSNHIESKLQDGPWWNWGWYNSGYVGKIKYCGNTQSPIVCFTSMFLGKQNKVWKGIHFSPVCSRQRTRPVRIQQSFCVPFTGWIETCEMQILFFAWRYIIYILLLYSITVSSCLWMCSIITFPPNSRQLLFQFTREVVRVVVNGCIGFTREVVLVVVYCIAGHCSFMSTRRVVPVIATITMSYVSTFSHVPQVFQHDWPEQAYKQ
jgi:hypothetical protein